MQWSEFRNEWEFSQVNKWAMLDEVIDKSRADKPLGCMKVYEVSLPIQQLWKSID
jgi:hypothetical protein